jgi:hypothetical protein
MKTFFSCSGSWLFFLCLISCNLPLKAQISQEEPKVKAVVMQLFEAMRKGDSAMAHQLFHPSARLQSISQQAVGAPVLKTEETVEGFLKAIGTPHEEVWYEQALGMEVRIDAQLATVWCPYEFYAGDKFSHAGVNSFQLFKTAQGWKILHIVDTRRKPTYQKNRISPSILMAEQECRRQLWKQWTETGSVEALRQQGASICNKRPLSDSLSMVCNQLRNLLTLAGRFPGLRPEKGLIEPLAGVADLAMLSDGKGHYLLYLSGPCLTGCKLNLILPPGSYQAEWTDTRFIRAQRTQHLGKHSPASQAISIESPVFPEDMLLLVKMLPR